MENKQNKKADPFQTMLLFSWTKENPSYCNKKEMLLAFGVIHSWGGSEIE